MSEVVVIDAVRTPIGRRGGALSTVALVASGVVDVAVACGVESMSRIPIGSNSSKKLGLGVAIPKSYFPRYEFTSQFEGAERIADKWGITRERADSFGLASQQRAAQAWEQQRFATQVVPVTAPVADAEGNLTGDVRVLERDEGLAKPPPTVLEVCAPLHARTRCTSWSAPVGDGRW